MLIIEEDKKKKNKGDGRKKLKQMYLQIKYQKVQNNLKFHKYSRKNYQLCKYNTISISIEF